MEKSDSEYLVPILQKKNELLEGRERELAEQKEELQAQKEELTAAIEEVVLKNNSLTETLQQLQKRNEELDQILYRASHDLKTPVSSLEGLLELLRGESLTPDQRNIHQYMEQKVSQMNDILKSLTMFAQASFDKIDLKEVLLAKTVQQAIRDLNYLPNFNNVTIEVTYNELEKVRTDELVLYNILKCLISNSITYRDTLQEGFVWVNFSKSETNLSIEVIDDGEGISPAISSEIFNMFYRGSERSLGQGLGLYIVKSVVERMKGQIRWISKSGKTTFQVILPES